MKPNFKEGNTTNRRIVINKDRTITVAGGEFDVYATPEMIRDIEQTCKSYILEFAEEGEDSVGTQVNISHGLLGYYVNLSLLERKKNTKWQKK